MYEGLLPPNPTHVLRFDTDENAAQAMTALLGEVFDPAETAVASFETEDGHWHVEAYFAHAPDEAGVRDLLRLVIGDRADEVTFSAIAQKDWVRASLDGLKPVRAGRFLVHGSHDRHTVRTNDIAIEIDAALAFGTGHHGTTLGCLLALADELRRRRPQRVLDVGTGTGILALAAARAVRRRVVAGDIDPVAVAVARANARLNGAGQFIRYYAAPGVRHALANRPRRFDLVFANILAKPLRQLAPAIAGVLSGPGTLVLSGLLPRDVPGVLSAYAAQGLRLWKRSEREGWATLVLRRGGAAPGTARAHRRPAG
ncbi:50S ribosomal protein L11 methyltransferase [Pseudochelatococcus lubricantis]|uniref:50S ribosomal protein L11 methyltransferase n=1 Tax=Pseudochelatococcus lubricantis TaxID=1538102 RepID=UPI0035E9316F